MFSYDARLSTSDPQEESTAGARHRRLASTVCFLSASGAVS